MVHGLPFPLLDPAHKALTLESMLHAVDTLACLACPGSMHHVACDTLLLSCPGPRLHTIPAPTGLWLTAHSAHDTGLGLHLM